MNISTRLTKLEKVSAPREAPVLTIRIMPDGKEMTLDELAALPDQDLLRAYRDTTNALFRPMTPERKQQLEALKVMALDELKQLYTNATGEKWD